MLLAEKMRQISQKNNLVEFYSDEKALIFYQKMLDYIQEIAQSGGRLVEIEFDRIKKNERSDSRMTDVVKMYRLLSSKAKEDGFHVEFIDGLSELYESYYKLKISW